MHLPSGWYYITRMVPAAGAGTPSVRRRLRVWCDMVSDGGGYTLYPIKKALRQHAYQMQPAKSLFADGRPTDRHAPSHNGGSLRHAVL